MEDSKPIVESLEMPQSIIARLIKNSFEEGSGNMIVNKQAKQAFQQTSGLFILYIFSM